MHRRSVEWTSNFAIEPLHQTHVQPTGGTCPAGGVVPSNKRSSLAFGVLGKVPSGEATDSGSELRLYFSMSMARVWAITNIWANNDRSECSTKLCSFALLELLVRFANVFRLSFRMAVKKFFFYKLSLFTDGETRNIRRFGPTCATLPQVKRESL